MSSDSQGYAKLIVHVDIVDVCIDMIVLLLQLSQSSYLGSSSCLCTHIMGCLMTTVSMKHAHGSILCDLNADGEGSLGLKVVPFVVLSV